MKMEMRFITVSTPENTVVTEEAFHHHFISTLNTLCGSHFGEAQRDDAIVLFNSQDKKTQNLLINTLSELLKIQYPSAFNYYYGTYTAHLQVPWAEGFRA